MKHYNSTMTLQNFGSALLIILRGKTEDVKQSFYSFFNYHGANGELDLSEIASGAVGVFWTNDASLRRYWYNRFCLAHPALDSRRVKEGKNKKANQYVEAQILAMRSDSEAFMSFDNRYIPDELPLGKISAESPDLSFKEAAHAHTSKAQSETEI